MAFEPEPDHLVLIENPLSENEFVSADTGAPLDSLGPLGRLNIFVGANSSGKSRLLRALAKRKRFPLATAEVATRLREGVRVLATLRDHYTSLANKGALRKMHGVMDAAAFGNALGHLRTQLSDEAAKNHPALTTIDQWARMAGALPSDLRPTETEIPHLLHLQASVNAVKAHVPARRFVTPLRSAHTLSDQS